MSKKTISGQHNGHEFVEIGGIKWATCNVGADKPTDMGLYFQWGDRKGYTADEVGDVKVFHLDTYKHYNDERFTKYTEFDGKHVLDLCDDAAFSYMGQGWRMPTCEDFRCLLRNTTDRWTNNYHRSGISGIVLTDRTDKSKELFFPAAGCCGCKRVSCVGVFGYYWSISLPSDSVFNACCLYFDSYIVCLDSCSVRCYGVPIRGILTI